MAPDCKIIFLTFSWKGYQSFYMKFSPSLYSHHWLDSNPSPWDDEVRILPLCYIGPRGQCYKTDTAVINCHFRLNYCSNFYNITLKIPWNGSKLPQYFNPWKSWVKITAVNYWNKLLQYFKTFAQEACTIKLFTTVIYIFSK